MVLKGQFLERPTLIPVGSVVLEGLSHRGALRPGLLVLPPTPQEGGGMDHVAGAELAWAASQAGYPTLRFNYRGVAGSQGAPSKGAALLEDAAAALELLRENAPGPAAVVACIGDSALVGLALAERTPAVQALVLINPGASAAPALAHARVDWTAVVGQLDTRVDRPALAAAAADGAGALEVVAGADRSWQRNLPEVGKIAVRVLGRIGRAP